MLSAEWLSSPSGCSVRYRLRKMTEITHLQLDNAKKRLAMMIELAATDTD